MGQILAYAGLLEGKLYHGCRLWEEMRGGTANCSVIISEEFVGSPVVTEADTAIIMNLPSLVKYEKNVVNGGHLLTNSSLISEKRQKEVKAYEIAANDIANELGNAKVANMVMLGAYIELTRIVSKVNYPVTGESTRFIKKNLIHINEEALAQDRGCKEL